MSCAALSRKQGLPNLVSSPSYSKIPQPRTSGHERIGPEKKTSKRKKKIKGSIRTMGDFLCEVLLLLARIGGPLVLELLLYQQRFHLLGLFHSTRHATRFKIELPTTMLWWHGFYHVTYSIVCFILWKGLCKGWYSQGGMLGFRSTSVHLLS